MADKVYNAVEIQISKDEHFKDLVLNARYRSYDIDDSKINRELGERYTPLDLSNRGYYIKLKGLNIHTGEESEYIEYIDSIT